MDAQPFSERDICTKFISPALRSAGWEEQTQVSEEVSFTKGRIIVRGRLVSRGKGKRADYILAVKPNIRLAAIEAKDPSRSVGDDIQQALEYAEILNLPFAFASNGSGFVFHDRTGMSEPRERHLSLDQFPSPSDLWERLCAWKGLDAQESAVVLQDYHEDGSGKEPGCYQINAVNATTVAIPLPPLAEQHCIAAKVDGLMALCDQLEASLTATTTTRSRLLEALLHEALGGQAEAAA